MSSLLYIPESKICSFQKFVFSSERTNKLEDAYVFTKYDKDIELMLTSMFVVDSGFVMNNNLPFPLNVEEFEVIYE